MPLHVIYTIYVILGISLAVSMTMTYLVCVTKDTHSFYGLVQDCSNSIAHALDLLQSFTTISICVYIYVCLLLINNENQCSFSTSQCVTKLDVLPSLAFSGSFVIFISYFFNRYEYTFPILHIYIYTYIYNNPYGNCANKLNPVLLTVRCMYGSGLFWTTQDNARRDKARQDVALRQPDMTKRVSLVLKNTVHALLVNKRWPARLATGFSFDLQHNYFLSYITYCYLYCLYDGAGNKHISCIVICIVCMTVLEINIYHVL